MKLSEQLKQDHECGDFGKALEGYSERAKKIEDELLSNWFLEAAHWGASTDDALAHAQDRLSKI